MCTSLDFEKIANFCHDTFHKGLSEWSRGIGGFKKGVAVRTENFVVQKPKSLVTEKFLKSQNIFDSRSKPNLETLTNWVHL